MARTSRVLFTVGHSNHTLSHFLELLARHKVTALADVRSRPKSRFSHFNGPALAKNLEGVGIKYLFLGDELGARRSEPECYEAGQAVYEKIAVLPAFRRGLDRIADELEEHRIALMCAEKEPLDCHRTILICRQFRGIEVEIRHILADGKAEPHPETEQRLLGLYGGSRSLFDQDSTDQQRLDIAYEKRGRQVAFRMKDDGAPG